MTISARSLLHELDPLPFPGRQQLLSRTAKELAGTDELDALLRDLTGGDRYARRLALQMASVVSHRDCIISCLDLGDVTLAARAIKVAVRLQLATAELTDLVSELPPVLRQVLYRACKRHRANELVESILPIVRSRWGDNEASALLRSCATETVRQLLPELEYAVCSWAALARHHPEAVLEFFEGQLAVLPPAAWGGLWRQVGPGIAALVTVEPDRVLTLLERSTARVGFPVQLMRGMAVLARHDPDRMLRIVLDPRRPGAAPAGRNFWRAFVNASDKDLIALARTVGNFELPLFLHTIPPRRRTRVYRALIGGRDLVGTGLPVSLIDELPRPARVAEAIRQLGLPRVADDQRNRLQVTARLEWDAARTVLAEATRHPAAADRAEAYSLYVFSARLSREPAAVSVMLASLDRLANEQDPVRSSALVAIAAIPGWLFADETAERLRTLMTDGMQARDSSFRTRNAIGILARNLIREGAISRRPALVDVGLDGLELLSQHQSYPGLYGLSHDLPRGTEQLVFNAISSRLDADARLGRYTMALALAASLGRRSWDIPALQDLVGEARSAKDDATVRQAIVLWLGPPKFRDDRVQQILRADRSTITIPAVQAAVSRRRTDLLDDIFRRSQHGRFLKKGVRFLPSFYDCFDAWLPRQTATFSELLLNLATAPGVSVNRRVSAVHGLSRMPGTIDDLRLLVQDAEVAVQEAALAGLAWSDEPAAVMPDLVSHAHGDRARVAVYALARCARFATAEQVSANLEPLLQAPKVTTRKEAVRLLAQHRTSDASVLLSQAWSDPRQHRDVRRAIVSAIRFLLDAESSWNLLRAASAAPELATALLEASPSTLALRHRARYAELVGTVARSRDVETARAGLTALPSWALWAGSSHLDIAASHVTDLSSTGTWRQALTAMTTASNFLEDGQTILAVTSMLIDFLDVVVIDRDQPARQRLISMASQVRAQLGDSSALRGAAQQAADLMAHVAPAVALDLAAAAIAWEDEDTVVATLLHIADLADRPLLSLVAQRGVAASLSRVLNRLALGESHRIARALIDFGTPSAAMIALGIVQTAGRAVGWQSPWSSLIAELRASSDPDVAAAAIETFTALE